MKNRVSNAPTNLTRRFEARYRAQRKGQALLLAVVVMLFVALISAGFLATVSGNLNQTARTSEKNRAIEAARAGMTYINNRINSSAEGENWRPYLVSVLPTKANLPAYEAYYTPLARVQGWVSNETLRDGDGNLYQDLSFARFPDPKSPVNGDEPQFYAKVERIALTAAERALRKQSEDAARAGQLKITVIGLGKTDPNVFHRMVAYRGGYDAAPIGRVARSVSTFDFTKGSVISGTTGAAIGAGATSIPFSKVTGNFPNNQSSNGYWVTVTDTSNGTVVTRAFATNYANQELTVSAALPAIPANSRVEIASPLGGPVAIDFNRDATASTTDETVSLNSADNTFFSSARINGTAYWQGNAKMVGLRAKTTDITNTTYPQTIESSGLMVVDGSVVAGVDDASAQSVDSTNTAVDRTLVSDGKNAIQGGVDSLRQTKPFSAPDLTSEASLSRYRGLTRDSKPRVNTYFADSSTYGYGQGIYIDNIQDREKIATAANVFKEMSQKDLIQLWTSTDTDRPEYRDVSPAVTIPASNVDDKSLEEKRLRGWIAKDEFRPRGVTIELFNKANVPMIGITRDALSDTTTTGDDASLPIPSKAWKNPNDPNFGTPRSGVYYEEVAFNSTNGVIFAEGNVRIKGNASQVNKSLTVVSLGNIYIEGSLGIDNDADTATESNRKVLLLARKNVVVNPTTVISRPEGYTSSNGPSTPRTPIGFNIPVAEEAGFKKGDYIQVPTVATPLLVIDVADNLLAVDQDPQVTAAGAIVQMAKDTVDPSRRNSRIATYNAVLQRRIPSPILTLTDIPAMQKMTFRHIAEQVKAADLSLDATGADPPATSATLFVKSIAPPATLPTAGVITNTEKNFLLTENSAARSLPLPASATLADLLTAIDSGAPDDWEYNLTYANPLFSSVPSLALAGVGNQRPDSITALPSTRDSWDLDILGGAKPLYVATSVAARTYGSDHTKDMSSIGSDTNSVRGFGFNPDPLLNEDAFTTDVAFYGDATNVNFEQTVLPDTRQIFLPVSDQEGSTFSFKLNKVTGLEGDNVTSTTPNPIPAYNLFGMRLDSANADGSGAGHILKIDAYVYAQTGSWIVIPSGYFDPNVKNVGIDINRDGQLAGEGVEETNPAIIYARYNYGIEFRGAIAENQSALIEDVGAVKGVVKDWMDKWTYPTNETGTTWQPIKYTFDPTYLLGRLDADPTIDPSNPAYATGPQAGFYMPVANDILYQE